MSSSIDHTIYGLVGRRLTHSFSKDYFEKKFKKLKLRHCEYLNFELDDPRQFEEMLQTPGLRAFNVTIPYKKTVIGYLDYLDSTAALAGAVNCVIKRRNRWCGYNTDVVGIEQSLTKLLTGSATTNALILGTGGAANAVAIVLQSMKISFKHVSRNPANGQLSYEALTATVLEESKLIINTTPLGMFPNIDNVPDIRFELLRPDHFLFDLIYNPSKTLFLKKGGEQGCTTMNGHEMLVTQAEASWKIWTHKM